MWILNIIFSGLKFLPKFFRSTPGFLYSALGGEAPNIVKSILDSKEKREEAKIKLEEDKLKREHELKLASLNANLQVPVPCDKKHFSNEKIRRLSRIEIETEAEIKRLDAELKRFRAKLIIYIGIVAYIMSHAIVLWCVEKGYFSFATIEGILGFDLAFGAACLGMQKYKNKL